jgi:hypothetical protein
MTWDEALVRDIFFPIDAEFILGTPIRDEFEDYVAWQFDSKGVFSVKPAYRLYVQDRDGPRQSSSNANVHEIQWKKIWKIIAQPKVKKFMWRLAHNSLATKRNIQSRGIECDTRCVCCNRLDEDGAHLDQTYNRMCQAVNAKEVVQIVLSLKEEECSLILPSFQNIRYFRFVKQMYLDIF